MSTRHPDALGPIAALEAEVAELRRLCKKTTVAVFRIGIEVGEYLEAMRHYGSLEAANRPWHLRPVK